MKDAVIGRWTAVAMAAAFAVLISVPAAHQAASEAREGSWKFLSLFRRVPSAESLKEFEEILARDSKLGALGRTGFQRFLTGLFRQGNDKVLLGSGDFLFLRKEVEMASGPGFLCRRSRPRRGSAEAVPGRPPSDPVQAILHYDRLLRERGIRLVFVPLPLKPFVYPEKVWPGYPREAGPAWNIDRASFLHTLARAGVDVLDVTDDLWRAKEEGEVFLRQDTHWTPLGLGAAAERIALELRPLVGAPRTTYASRTVPVTNGGDLLRMIDFGRGPSPFRPQTVETLRIDTRSGDEAPVLLLGDSFTNVYSRRELEWGEGAGLGEQLALRLGTPVQVLALNGGGATAVRMLLLRKASALSRKKVVVWACSARDLFDEAISWEEVALPGDP
jgi:alginate O-acetyltransferase complex protein AlgJ